MSAYDCFEHVIGFTRGECPCVDGYSVDYTISDSGLYVDELQGMALRGLQSAGGCADLWEKMIRARENAINKFKTDIVIEMDKYKELIRTYFSGDIGYKTFTYTLAKDAYHGLRMCSDVKGGKFILRGVSLILNTTEAVNLEIYDEYDLLYTYPLTSVAGRPHKTTITPVELPLDRNYYFLIQSAGLPYNNKLSCGCGGYKWCFDSTFSCMKRSRDKWTEWCMVGGVTGDDLADRDDWTVCSSCYGMQLHGNFVCQPTDLLCSEESDFVNNPIDNSIAWAILYKTGEFLTNYIMDSPEVSRYTLLQTENLEANRVFYNKNYAILADYIAKNIEDERTDCYRCRQPLGMGKRTQLL